MIRKAFIMAVHADAHEEYQKRHQALWPEMEKTLKSHGVHQYSIFLNPKTSQLFAWAEIESEERWTAIASTEVCRRWWNYMADIMPTNPDNSPQSQELTEVFHLD